MSDAALERLRQEANDLFNDDQLEAYLERVPGLETDELLRGLWWALAGYAAWQLGRGEEAERWLERAISGRFAQPEMIPEGIQSHPRWAEFALRMRANLPAPRVSLCRFPEFDTDVPLWTRALPPERQERLLELLPAPRLSAWETATHLLSWVQQQWRHDGNNNAEQADALELLERASRGERFRCVEYGILLAGALNAHGIVARTCALKMPDYHAGTGRGHVVTEAWIDEFGEWVVLDGQNGGYWTLEGKPLGARELCQRFWQGDEAPEFVHLGETPLDDASRRFWYPYFAYPQSGDAMWISRAAPFPLVFQTRHPLRTERVTRNANRVWADLNGFDLGISATPTGPGLKLSSPHPACQGFEVNGQRFSGNPAVIPLEEFAPRALLRLRAFTRFASLRSFDIELEWNPDSRSAQDAPMDEAIGASRE
jgi:Transglutaminase-like superfamily